MSRGYLWQDLSAEVAVEFAQTHPLAMLSIGADWRIPSGWSIVDGDAPQVRQRAGLCRVCGSERDKSSKVYCGYHLLMTRQTERARYTPKPKVIAPVLQDRCEQHGHVLLLDLTTKKQMVKVFYCPVRGCKHEVTR